jgi:hypothetical protein
VVRKLGEVGEVGGGEWRVKGEGRWKAGISPGGDGVLKWRWSPCSLLCKMGGR